MTTEDTKKKKASKEDDKKVKERFRKLGVPEWTFWNNFYFMKNPNQLTLVYFAGRGIPLCLLIWFVSSDMYMPFINDALQPFEAERSERILFLKRLFFYTPVCCCVLAYMLFLSLIPSAQRRKNRRPLRTIQYDCFIFSSLIVMLTFVTACITGNPIYPNLLVCCFLISKAISIIFNLFKNKLVGYMFILEIFSAFPMILFYKRHESIQWAAILLSFVLFIEDWCASGLSLAKATALFFPIRTPWIHMAKKTKTIAFFVATFFVIPAVAVVFQTQMANSGVLITICVYQFFKLLYQIHQIRVGNNGDSKPVNFSTKKNQ